MNIFKSISYAHRVEKIFLPNLKIHFTFFQPCGIIGLLKYDSQKNLHIGCEAHFDNMTAGRPPHNPKVVGSNPASAI
jgi:hypothetical protein